jgi:polysaccharide pyruvyl transferase WcaK-like protein
MKRGTYQGWLGWRNLGDEAIFQACRRSLSHICWTWIPLEDACPPVLFTTIRYLWTRHVIGHLVDQVGILSGGTIINRTSAWLDQYRLLRKMVNKPVPVFSPGVADPSFWSRIRGWRDTRAGWRGELAGLPEVGVRGPSSKRLLDEAGFHNVVIAGDPALAFHRGPTPPPSVRRRAVAVNAGRSKGQMWGSEDRAITALADGVRRLAAARFDVRIFPVWDEDEPVCLEVADAAGLPRDVVDPLILDAEAFLQYLDNFDIVLSVKLHAAVLAAAAGVPFAAVEYQPKVRDFTESIGWEQFTFRSDCFEGADLARAVQEIYDNLAVCRERLAVRVGGLAEGFRAFARRTEQFLLAS